MGTRRPTSQLATTTNSTMADVPVSHMLHSGYANPTLRAWQATDTTVGPDNLMYPLFIVDDPDAEQSIGAMPGVSRFGVNRLEGHLVPLVANGLSSVLLFGVPFDLPKDGRGSCADEPTTPVILAIKKIKKLFPDLVIACDVFIYHRFKRSRVYFVSVLNQISGLHL